MATSLRRTLVLQVILLSNENHKDAKEQRITKALCNFVALSLSGSKPSLACVYFATFVIVLLSKYEVANLSLTGKNKTTTMLNISHLQIKY